MSISQRLWILVLSSTLLSLAGSLALNVHGARYYIQQQLQAEGDNAATSLALNLSQQAKDKATAELYVSALLDSGHFERISYFDAAEQLVIQRVNNLKRERHAPDWFVRLIPMEQVFGSAWVSDGWRQAGRVEVVADSHHAYLALYAGCVNLVGAYVALALGLGLLMMLLTHGIRAPIQRMVRQANGVEQGRFDAVPVSGPSELQSIGNALNRMVVRVHALFAEQVARIEALQRAATQDPLTKAATQVYFLQKFSAFLRAERESDGLLVVVKVLDLQTLNEQQGRVAADTVLLMVVQQLKLIAEMQAQAIVGRLNGSEFALYLPVAGVEEFEMVRLQLIVLKAHLTEGAVDLPQSRIKCGLVRCTAGATSSELLKQVDQIFTQEWHAQEVVTVPAPLEQSVTLVTRSVPPWRDTFDRIFEERLLAAEFFKTVNVDGDLIHLKVEAICNLPNGPVFGAQQLAGMARRVGRLPMLDLELVKIALQKIRHDGVDVCVAIQTESATTGAFCESLDSLLRKHQAQAQRLWVGVQESSTEPWVGRLEQLDKVCRAHRCKLGIEGFGQSLSALPRLHRAGVHYLRLDDGLTENAESDSASRSFLDTMVQVLSGLSILILVGPVASDMQKKLLFESGISGCTLDD